VALASWGDCGQQGFGLAHYKAGCRCPRYRRRGPGDTSACPGKYKRDR
jgi:hypothetical protein